MKSGKDTKNKKKWGREMEGENMHTRLPGNMEPKNITYASPVVSWHKYKAYETNLKSLTTT